VPALSILAATEKAFTVFCRSAAGITMLVIMGLVFAEVVSRFVLGVSHEYVPAISSWAMVWMTYFVLGVVLKTRGHISVDILLNKVPPARGVILLAFIDIVSLAFAILLLYGGTRYDLMVRQSDIYAVTVQFVPMWIVRICVPLGGFFLAFFSIEHLVSDARVLMKRREIET
jgi:TRAP-type C4-dicarboxylate transport system permease small subunit